MDLYDKPSWLVEHKKLYGEKGNPPPKKAQAPTVLFPTVQVTVVAHEKIEDLIGAMCEMNAAQDKESIEAAYGKLSARRRELYEYVAMLEAQVGYDRKVTKRF